MCQLADGRSQPQRENAGHVDGQLPVRLTCSSKFASARRWPRAATARARIVEADVYGRPQAGDTRKRIQGTPRWSKLDFERMCLEQVSIAGFDSHPGLNRAPQAGGTAHDPTHTEPATPMRAQGRSRGTYTVREHGCASAQDQLGKSQSRVLVLSAAETDAVGGRREYESASEYPRRRVAARESGGRRRGEVAGETSREDNTEVAPV